jgi:hypothetical protein
LPAGPSSLEDLYAWDARYAKILLADPDVRSLALANLRDGIVSVSDYSGVGCAEIALVNLVNAMRAELGRCLVYVLSV